MRKGAMVLGVIISVAGWSGIAAARTYLQVNPDAELTIIDADSMVGGTWSSARIYPGLCADSPSGAFEFSDLPMTEELGILPWKDLTGDYVHEYLERYVRKYGLLERCRLETEVVNANQTRS
jgi:dimethylaniline monooxygenase (N-oxide forming)